MAELQVTLRRSTIQRRWIKCGKQNCGKCPHGPYFYRLWREGRHVRTEYLGLVAPPTLEGHIIPEIHPFKLGESARFGTNSRLYWVVVRGKKQIVRDDAPDMLIDGVGWGKFGQSRQIYPYVTLQVEKIVDGKRGRGLEPVHHPYDGAMTGADPAGRLDRRFPTPLLEKVVRQ